MLIRKFLLASLCLPIALAGCGGGGSDNVPVATGPTTGTSPTPSPTPAPTPTPSPTPSGPVTGAVRPSADAVYQSAMLDLTTTGGSSETNGVITGGTTTNRTLTIDNPQFSASYSPRDGFILKDGVNTASFNTRNLTGDTTTLNGNGAVAYQNKSGSIEDYLVLYQASTYVSSRKGAGYTTAQYAGYAAWQHTVLNGSSSQSRLNYFAFGPPTPIGAVPKAGVLQYSILNAGNYATNDSLFFTGPVSGNTLTIDFATGRVTGVIGFGGQNFYKNEVGGVGSIRIDATLTGTSASGDLLGQFTRGNEPGRYRLTLVGPNANELILTVIVGTGDDAFVGSMVGFVNPYL